MNYMRKTRLVKNEREATTIQDGVHSKYVIVKFTHSPDAIEVELMIFGKISVML